MLRISKLQATHGGDYNSAAFYMEVKMEIPEKYLEIKRHTGEGYTRLVDFESWTAAAINYSKNFDRKNFSSVSRHNKSDETFVLIDGSATLAVGEAERLVTVDLEKNKFYNVKRGVWHALFASPDAKLIVAENSDTGAENSDTYMGAKLSDDTNQSFEEYLETGGYDGEGYSRVIESDGWTAAVINPSDKFTKESFVRMERHNATDEVFILTEGSARLIVGEPDNPQFVEMEKYAFYNVKKGAWHHIIVDEGAKIVIVENSDTGMANSEYHSVR